MLRTTHCQFCSIVPPYLLLKLAEESADPEVREQAIATLQFTRQARVQRVAMASNLSVTPAPAAAPAVKKRRIFDCENSNDLLRTHVRKEGDAETADIAVNEAYDYSGITWDFFNMLAGRNSIDGNGLPMTSSVHYSANGKGFDNAFWNGSQMIYGDGGKIFHRLTQSLDVVAHELTHGITQYSAGLPYENQSGALNEHFSDVFGVVVRQWHEKEADPKTAGWLVGEGLMLAGSHYALRSLKAPGTAFPGDIQPDHMSKYKKLANNELEDYGGVHINSGIPNRAFYLAAVALGGPSWETAANIWYKTLTQRLKGTSSFEKCAYETISVARDFFDDATAAKVAKAWLDVGVISGTEGPVASLSMPVV